MCTEHTACTAQCTVLQAVVLPVAKANLLTV